MIVCPVGYNQIMKGALGALLYASVSTGALTISEWSSCLCRLWCCGVCTSVSLVRDIQARSTTPTDWTQHWRTDNQRHLANSSDSAPAADVVAVLHCPARHYRTVIIIIIIIIFVWERQIWPIAPLYFTRTSKISYLWLNFWPSHYKITMAYTGFYHGGGSGFSKARRAALWGPKGRKRGGIFGEGQPAPPAS